MVSGRRPVHGHTKKGVSSPTYRTWRAMHIRCTKPNHVKYHRYGGAGIGICEKWMTFLGFLEDMGVCTKQENAVAQRKDNANR